MLSLCVPRCIQSFPCVDARSMTLLSRLQPIFLSIVCAGILAACSASASLTPVEQPDALPVAGPADVADFETFDPSPYREEPVPVQDRIEHDVPEALMTNRAGEGVEVQVDGFRVQLLSTVEKQEADQMFNTLRAWWQDYRTDVDSTTAPLDLLDAWGQTPPVEIIFRQPYYRVRAGNFVQRQRAEEALRLLVTQYPDAFIVPDQVTITR